MPDQDAKTEAEWWTLDQVVGWVREIDPTASIAEIRIALERRCGLGRIGARGRRRHYSFDAVLAINDYDPNFVWFSEEHGRLQSWFDQISLGEWKDLTFFARPTLIAGEPYHLGLARALDRLDSPVELRSRSKYRLAWSDVEFRRNDVIAEWAHPDDDAGRFDPPAQPLNPGIKVVRASPVSEHDLRHWYRRRIETLTACGRSSSGEEDWAAAKEQFPDRVTRARVRSIRDQCAPLEWHKQGRRTPKTAK
jgi:hypothetical protein